MTDPTARAQQIADAVMAECYGGAFRGTIEHELAIKAATRAWIDGRLALSERVRWLDGRAAELESASLSPELPDTANDLQVRAMTMRSLARHFAQGAHLSPAPPSEGVE